MAFPWVVSSTGPGGFMICVNYMTEHQKVSLYTTARMKETNLKIKITCFYNITFVLFHFQVCLNSG